NGRVKEMTEGAIKASVAEFVKAYNSKSAAGAALVYADDAAAFPPDMLRVDGRENIQKLWQGAIDLGISDMTLTAVEVEEAGNLAYATGTFTVKAPGKDGGKPVDTAGKYVSVWKKGQDGNWKIFRDIWNNDPAE